MLDCRLVRNKNKSRCKILRQSYDKPKSQLSWREAKAMYPSLKPYGNADKDKHVNSKDCRPFNKHKHMVSVYEDDAKVIYATPREYKAFKKIQYGRKMGLPPIETHKELKKDGLTSDEMRNGLALFEASKEGIEIYEGTPIGYGEDSYVQKKIKDVLWEPPRSDYEREW